MCNICIWIQEMVGAYFSITASIVEYEYCRCKLFCIFYQSAFIFNNFKVQPLINFHFIEFYEQSIQHFYLTLWSNRDIFDYLLCLIKSTRMCSLAHANHSQVAIFSWLLNVEWIYLREMFTNQWGSCLIKMEYISLFWIIWCCLHTFYYLL